MTSLYNKYVFTSLHSESKGNTKNLLITYEKTGNVFL